MQREILTSQFPDSTSLSISAARIPSESVVSA
jgi:hypothetical protein